MVFMDKNKFLASESLLKLAKTGGIIMQPNKHTVCRIPLDSKLSLAAGIVMAVAILYSLTFSVLTPGINNIQKFLGNSFASILYTSLTYLYSLLTGALFAVLTFTIVKKSVKLLAIPMFMPLPFVILGLVSNLIILPGRGINVIEYYDHFFIWLTFIIRPAVSLALPVVFILTAYGKIKTKIPFVVICAVNLYNGGPVGFAAWSFVHTAYGNMSVIEYGYYSMIMGILSAVPYLLIALALSNKTDKEYYSKPVRNTYTSYAWQPTGGVSVTPSAPYSSAPLPHASPPSPYATPPSPPSSPPSSPPPALSRYCGKCGDEVLASNVFCPTCGSKIADQLVRP